MRDSCRLQSLLQDAAAVVQMVLIAAAAIDVEQGEAAQVVGVPFHEVDGIVSEPALPAFFDALLLGLGIDAGSIPDRLDPRSWPEIAATFENAFATSSVASTEASSWMTT